MSADFFREERTRTVIRHVIACPVQWVDVQKLLTIVLREMGYPGRDADRNREPSDDAVWYEIEDDHLAICYEEISGSNGGPSNSERLP